VDACCTPVREPLASSERADIANSAEMIEVLSTDLSKKVALLSAHNAEMLSDMQYNPDGLEPLDDPETPHSTEEARAIANKLADEVSKF
jgi:hypothetical protein